MFGSHARGERERIRANVNYVGRTSAFAVAVGVGFAVATGPGAAWADPATETGGSTDPTAEAPKTVDTDGSHDSTTESGSRATTDGSAATGTTDSPSGGSPTESEVTVSGTGPVVIIRSSGGYDGTTTAGTETSAPAVEAQQTTGTATTPTEHQTPPTAPTLSVLSGWPVLGSLPPPAAPPPATPVHLGHLARTAPPALRARAFDGRFDTESRGAEAPPTARLLDTRTQDAEVNVDTAAAPEFDHPIVTAAPADPVAHPLTAPDGFVTAASVLLTNVFNALWTPTGDAPADSPVIWAVLALVRRQFNGPESESTPIPNPRQTSRDYDEPKDPDAAVSAADGTVTGTLGIADPNGGPLTITFADGGVPKYGSVEFDTATGAYTYTPNLAGRLRAGLGGAADGFTVLVQRGAGAQAAFASLAAVSEAVTVGDIPIPGAVLNVAADPVAVGVRPVGVAVSPDGARVFVTDAQSGGVYAIPVGTDAVDVVSAAADTAPIIAGGYRGPNDYYVPNGGMAFSADGSLLYVSRQHAEIVGGMFMPAAGDIVVIGNDPADRETYLKVIGDPIDAYTATLQLGGVEVGPPPLGTTVSPDGSVGYVVDTATRTISVLDLVANEKILDVALPVPHGEVSIVGVGPDGTTLYLGDSGGETVTSVTLV
jgi:hypothetical protein